MAVIPFPMDLSPQGPNPSMSWELRSLTARNMSPLNGVATTLERAGSHWSARLPYENLASDRRARLQTFAASCRGHAQRFYVPVFGWTRRGSFPSTELLTNNTFASGTTGWTWAGGSNSVVQSAADGVLRATWAGGALVSTDFIRRTAAVSITQYAPYAMRYLMTQGKYAGTVAVRFRDGTSAAISTGADAAVGGLATHVYTPESTSVISCVNDTPPAGTMAGDYILFHYASLARCALVDNGPNLLLQSDELDTSWTPGNASVDDQTAGTTDPLGTSTADSIIEDATAGVGHLVSQNVTVSSSTLLDYAFSCALKAGARTRVSLIMRETTGSSDASANFNLSTGAVVSFGTGANWANARAFIQSLGDGWYQCTIVGRKTNAATTVQCQIRLTDASGNTVYNGDGTSNAYAWRATLAQSGVPTRLSLTTTAATSGTSQTGSALHLKGLPASTNGLLLQGDPVEIIIGTTSQLVRTRSSLNSDAAGLGYFEFEPPLRVSPADNAAVIVTNPLCKMMMDNNVNGWTDRAVGFSDLEFAAVEDTYPS